MNSIKLCGLSIACSLFLLSCETKPDFPDNFPDDMPPEMQPPGMGGNLADDSDAPEFDTVITENDYSMLYLKSFL